MASAAYNRWVSAGEPYRDAQPVTDLATILRAHGYTVFTRGDESHMQAVPPEDHTPFSSTGWPVKSTFGVGHALDVMPPAEASKLPTLAQLGAQIVADKNHKVSGAGGIKYINWTTANGAIVQDSWTPDHERNPSDDSGHIHISMRSDMDDTHTTYDPVARFQGDDMALKDDPDGLILVRRVHGIEAMLEEVDIGPAGHPRTEPVPIVAAIKALAAQLDALAAAVAALSPQPPTAQTFDASGLITLTPSP